MDQGERKIVVAYIITQCRRGGFRIFLSIYTHVKYLMLPPFSLLLDKIFGFPEAFNSANNSYFYLKSFSVNMIMYCCQTVTYFHVSFLYFAIIWLCSVYGEPIPVKELAERVASYVHLCTLYWWLRFITAPDHISNAYSY